MNSGIFNRFTKLNIVLFGLEHFLELLTKIYLFRRRGVIFGDDVRVPRDGIDDDKRIIYS